MTVHGQRANVHTRYLAPVCLHRRVELLLRSKVSMVLLIGFQTDTTQEESAALSQVVDASLAAKPHSACRPMEIRHYQHASYVRLTSLRRIGISTACKGGARR
jgi:hypothetical protein